MGFKINTVLAEYSGQRDQKDLEHREEEVETDKQLKKETNTSRSQQKDVSIKEINIVENAASSVFNSQAKIDNR